MMKRLFETELLKWKQKGMKKPLMVIGVRQVGKTHTINAFCKEHFKEYIYIDLEKNADIRNIFEKSTDPDVILSALELRLEKSIDLEETIFFFDEVQVSEKFIVSLKYFNESEKPFKIICAGSLLGVKLNRFNSSFPVGKINLLRMYPLNFEEFLVAIGKEFLMKEIKRCYNQIVPMAEDLHNTAMDLYRKYLCVGGMPEAVLNFISNGLNIMEFDKKILEILTEMYITDMGKYTISKFENIKIEKVYKNISQQLTRENSQRFKFSNIESGASKRKFESAVEWLVASGMVINCNLVETIMKPIKAYQNMNTFKLYLSDVGLLSSISGLNYSDIILDEDFMYKGVLAENYVACEFLVNDIHLNYWRSGNRSEIDFLLYNDDGIIPVEVKAAENTKSKSLKTYVERYNPKYSIRISSKNFGFNNNIKSIPLYSAFCIKE